MWEEQQKLSKKWQQEITRNGGKDLLCSRDGEERKYFRLLPKKDRTRFKVSLVFWGKGERIK